MSILEKKVVETTENWFNSNKQRNILLITTIILGIGLFLSFRSCNSSKSEIQLLKQNQSALTDSMRISLNKVKELEYSKDVLVSDNKNLKNLNSDLGIEINKENGKVFELNKIIASFKNNPGGIVYIPTTLIKYPNGEYGLDWKYDTIFNGKNNRHIAGTSKFFIKDSTITPDKTLLTRDEINFSLITGLKENKDGKMEIFVRSDYPGFNLINLEGAIIDPKDNPIFKTTDKPKRWGIGPYIGVGIGNSITPSIQIGIGISYSIIRL
jgi:hypothetical protein